MQIIKQEIGDWYTVCRGLGIIFLKLMEIGSSDENKQMG